MPSLAIDVEERENNGKVSYLPVDDRGIVCDIRMRYAAKIRQGIYSPGRRRTGVQGKLRQVTSSLKTGPI
jgi:hypothetical protein